MRSLLLAFAALALATSACRTTDGARAGGGDDGVRTVEGRVAEIGRDDGTITLEVGDERQEVLVASEAEIRIDDFKAGFEDLKEGQRVRASLDENGEQTEGFRILILDQAVPVEGAVQQRADEDASEHD